MIFFTNSTSHLSCQEFTGALCLVPVAFTCHTYKSMASLIVPSNCSIVLSYVLIYDLLILSFWRIHVAILCERWCMQTCHYFFELSH